MSRTVPLFVVCRQCLCLVRVQSPSDQRRRKHCSRACAARGRRIDPVAAARGRVLAHRRRREQSLEGLRGLTLLQAFQRGYMAGLRSKLTQIRRRFTLVPKAGTASTTSCGIAKREQVARR